MTAGSHNSARHTNVGEELLPATLLGSLFGFPPWLALHVFPARPLLRAQVRGRPTKDGTTANAASAAK